MKKSTIKEIKKRFADEIDHLDLDILIAHVIGKTREFVLSHPEFKLNPNHKSQITNYANRRLDGEPVAYIIGHKEFYGLDFKVNKHTLIPRPETEMMIDLALKKLNTKHKIPHTLIDIGTGSGNIIISIAKEIENHKLQIKNYELLASDISPEALRVAKENAKKHKVNKKINFLQGDLLNPFLENNRTIEQYNNIVIVANLPYLSQEIYDSSSKDVKNHEPKLALYSPQKGLAHYKKLLNQIAFLFTNYNLQITSLIEISPEQKPLLQQIIKNYLPDAKIIFHKDLAEKWRICEIKI